MEWAQVCRKYIGMRYNFESFNCRHLACAAFTDLTGYDANSIFGVGKNEGQLKNLSRGDFKRLKQPVRELTVLILKDAHGLTHVALKLGNDVLHNFGRDSFGQVSLSRWETVKSEWHHISHWVLK